MLVHFPFKPVLPKRLVKHSYYSNPYGSSVTPHQKVFVFFSTLTQVNARPYDNSQKHLTNSNQSVNLHVLPIKNLMHLANFLQIVQTIFICYHTYVHTTPCKVTYQDETMYRTVHFYKMANLKYQAGHIQIHKWPIQT